jgi:hypothetical protein
MTLRAQPRCALCRRLYEVCACGHAKIRIGETVVERLEYEYVSASLHVIDTARLKSRLSRPSASALRGCRVARGMRHTTP